MNSRLIILTVITLLSFAANSVLGRLALVNADNDPLSFTLIRLLSGALILFPFLLIHKNKSSFKISTKHLLPPLALFSYALFFSIAYVQIDAGLGALILFACVQITMIIASFLNGYRMSLGEKIGFILALLGFLYLLLPGASTPPITASLLMLLSGVSWGIYSLLGKTSKNPTFSTALNFMLCLPLTVLLLFIFPFSLNSSGIALAVISGALTSGLGYVLWYTVLKDLLTSTAAIVQLSVPALATLGGALFLGESIGFRIIIASLLIFSGIYLKVRAAK